MAQGVNVLLIKRLSAGSRSVTVVRQAIGVMRASDAIVLMVLLAATALAVSVYARTKVELDLALSKQRMSAERVVELRIKTDQLERRVQQLRSDPRMIESIARQTLGFVRPSDVVIRLAPARIEPERGVELVRSRGESDILTFLASHGYTPASN